MYGGNVATFNVQLNKTRLRNLVREKLNEYNLEAQRNSPSAIRFNIELKLYVEKTATFNA